MRAPTSWKSMSEADRVFSARKGQGFQTLTSEKRHIFSAPRRSGPGAGKSKLVEVVHVRRERSRPVENQPRPALWSVPAEARSESLRAKPAQLLPPQDMQPVAPDPAPPVVHVMPMWTPSLPQPAAPGPQPDDAPVGTAVTKQRKPRIAKTPTAKAAVRRFADPFSEEDGANCLRCGYLVQPARERRGLLTCATCG
jgi:hypothetical protein